MIRDVCEGNRVHVEKEIIIPKRSNSVWVESSRFIQSVGLREATQKNIVPEAGSVLPAGSTRGVTAPAGSVSSGCQLSAHDGFTAFCSCVLFLQGTFCLLNRLRHAFVGACCKGKGSGKRVSHSPAKLQSQKVVQEN